MIVDWPILLPALFLLWLPRLWLRRALVALKRALRWRRRRRFSVDPTLRPAGDPRVDFREEFAKLQNYLDLARGTVGAGLVFGPLHLHLVAALASKPGAPRLVVLQVAALRVAIVVAGLLLQTTRWEHRRLTFFPPIFYLTGLTFALCDPRAALFAVALIWAISPGLISAQAFLTIYALLVVVFGCLFARSISLAAALGGGLCFLPVLLSLLAKRPLLIMSRKRSQLGAIS